MKIVKKTGLSPALQKAINELKSKTLRVGWGENAAYENGAKVAMIAAQNEFGNPAKSIPPRPFFRPAIAEEKGKWAKTSGRLVISAIKAGGSVAPALETMGLVVAGDVRKSITKVMTPALKPATVKARLRGKKIGKSVSLTVAKPLVDTGHMLQTLTSEVVS